MCGGSGVRPTSNDCAGFAWGGHHAAVPAAPLQLPPQGKACVRCVWNVHGGHGWRWHPSPNETTPLPPQPQTQPVQEVELLLRACEPKSLGNHGGIRPD